MEMSQATTSLPELVFTRGMNWADLEADSPTPVESVQPASSTVADGWVTPARKAPSKDRPRKPRENTRPEPRRDSRHEPRRPHENRPQRREEPRQENWAEQRPCLLDCSKVEMLNNQHFYEAETDWLDYEYLNDVIDDFMDDARMRYPDLKIGFYTSIKMDRNNIPRGKSFIWFEDDRIIEIVKRNGGNLVTIEYTTEYRIRVYNWLKNKNPKSMDENAFSEHHPELYQRFLADDPSAEDEVNDLLDKVEVEELHKGEMRTRRVGRSVKVALKPLQAEPPEKASELYNVLVGIVPMGSSTEESVSLDEVKQAFEPYVKEKNKPARVIMDGRVYEGTYPLVIDVRGVKIGKTNASGVMHRGSLYRSGAYGEVAVVFDPSSDETSYIWPLLYHVDWPGHERSSIFHYFDYARAPVSRR